MQLYPIASVHCKTPPLATRTKHGSCTGEFAGPPLTSTKTHRNSLYKMYYTFTSITKNRNRRIRYTCQSEWAARYTRPLKAKASKRSLMNDSEPFLYSVIVECASCERVCATVNADWSVLCVNNKSKLPHFSERHFKWSEHCLKEAKQKEATGNELRSLEYCNTDECACVNDVWNLRGWHWSYRSESFLNRTRVIRTIY